MTFEITIMDFSRILGKFEIRNNNVTNKEFTGEGVQSIKLFVSEASTVT